MATVIVIGSGFGGAIAARRLTAKGHTVYILEMGENWTSASKLLQSMDPAYLQRLFRTYPEDFTISDPNMTVTQGMGYGGGSLVYSGIHIQAPPSALAGWPVGWRRDSQDGAGQGLDSYYTRVESELGIAPISNTFSYPRSSVFYEGVARAGLGTAQAMPLVMKPSCVKCGWCVPICKWGHKNTMQHSYLYKAAVGPASPGYTKGPLYVYTNYKARRITKVTATGKYRVRAWWTGGVSANYHRVNSGTEYSFDADWVVIACGAIESPALIRRSLTLTPPSGETKLADSSSYVYNNSGTGIDGTGDFALGGMVMNRNVDSYQGAIMMAYVDRGDYVIEDIHAIPVGPAAMYPISFNVGGVDRTWGQDYKNQMVNYGRHMLGVAIIGKSPSGANLSAWDDNGNAVISNVAYKPPTGSYAAAKSIITALGGTLVKTPYDRATSNPDNPTTPYRGATVHPVGGCRMGYVVSTWNLQLYYNPNVFVIDGSVLPGSPFRNPSHTIAAVAEKAMDRIVGAP